MKIFFVIVFVALSVNAFGQNTACFETPDGMFPPSNWSYKDYVIPNGFKIDSVYMDASRPGYNETGHDFKLDYCPGVETYNSQVAASLLDYSNITTSMYNVWIDLASANIKSTGMVRVSLPTTASAVWNELCFAVSPISSNVTCFETPDGLFPPSNWSYKDFIIPKGFKIYSIYMDASRPGYNETGHDFKLDYCSGVETYNSQVAASLLDYSNNTTSMYNVWLDLDSANIKSTGMVRVSLPTTANAVWYNLCFAVIPINSDTKSFDTPDGLFPPSNWSYKDYVIPNGFKIDSVYMDASRLGYNETGHDFKLDYCPGVETYNSQVASSLLDYSNTTTSMYKVWIDLTSANIKSIGMVRISLPTTAGAVWKNLHLSISASIPTNLSENEIKSGLFIYPNPTNGKIFLNTNEVVDLKIYNNSGQLVMSAQSNSGWVDVTELQLGIYFLKVMNTNSEIPSMYKFVKN